MTSRRMMFSLLLAGAPLAALAASSGGEDFQVTLWAASCMSCHGTDGRAEGTGLTIGGRNADELYNMLLGYKQGSRSATIMHQHARGYSDAELKRIAVYFSRIK